MSRSIFIGNLPYIATESKISELLRDMGFETEKIEMRGKFAFIMVRDHETALALMKSVNDKEWHRRRLRVDWSRNPQTTGNGAERTWSEVGISPRFFTDDPIISDPSQPPPAKRVADYGTSTSWDRTSCGYGRCGRGSSGGGQRWNER